MQVLEATYAMDDLHRIEAILATQRPSSSSYAAARSDTARVLREVQARTSTWLEACSTCRRTPAAGGRCCGTRASTTRAWATGSSLVPPLGLYVLYIYIFYTYTAYTTTTSLYNLTTT